MSSRNAIPEIETNGHGRPQLFNDDPPPNPFDLEALRLNQDFGAAVGVKRVLSKVPVTRPNKCWFVQTHPRDDYRCDAVLLELEDDKDTYWVAPNMWEALATEPAVVRRRLITSITAQQNVFLWKIGLPGTDGKINSWHESALGLANLANGTWLRVQANQQIGAYEPIVAAGEPKEPRWPDLTFAELVQLAFRDRCIASLDHPVLRQLRGEL